MSMEETPVTHNETFNNEEGTKKRKRKFLDKWIVTYPWIDYNELDGMYCKVCRDFCEEYEDKEKGNSMIVGSKNYQLSTIKRHEISKLHKKYCPNDEPQLKMTKFTSLNTTNFNEHRVTSYSTHSSPIKPSSSKITYLNTSNFNEHHVIPYSTNSSVNSENPKSVRACIVKLDGRPNLRLENIFRTIYYIEKLNIPREQYPSICELQRANGADLGNQYISDSSIVSEVSKYIALSFKQEIIDNLNESEYFGIILDEVIDSHFDTDIIVSVTTLKNGMKDTSYIGLIKSGMPSDIIKNLQTFFDGLKVNNPFKKLCALTTDGASIYFGNDNELSRLIQTQSPYLISFHCLAHKLQLLVKQDLNKKKINTECLNRLFKDVGKLYSFYLKSKSYMDELRLINESLRKEVDKLITIPKFQWSSHLHQSLNILLKNWTFIVQHLENVKREESDSALREKATKILRTIKEVSFLTSLAVYSDFYKLLGKTWERLRSNELLAHDVLIELEVLSQQLMVLGKDGTGVLRNITKELECGSFRGVEVEFENNNNLELSKEVAIVTKETADRVSSTIRNSSREIYKLNILDPRHWPEADPDSKIWRDFGVEEIQSLEPCVKSLIPNYDEILVQEWLTFKHTVFHSFPAVTKVCLRSLSQHFFKVFNDSFRFRGIRCLLYLTQLVSPNSEAAEISFNLMNEIKLKRNQESNLDTLITIRQKGPDIVKFEPAKAVQLWVKSKRSHACKMANEPLLQLCEQAEENTIDELF